MPQIIDLNNALVSWLLTGHDGFTTAAGHIGPNVRVDHDISMLIPEIWSRMFPYERNAEYLIKNGYLEKINDFEYQGKLIPASRLGYRMTQKFANNLFGRLFSNPANVLSEDMLKPERQDLESYADGILNIVETHEKVAKAYIADGTIELACPPLRTLLLIMANGSDGEITEGCEALEQMFTLESMLASSWYEARLKARQEVEIRYLKRIIAGQEKWMQNHNIEILLDRVNVPEKLKEMKARLAEVSKPDYWKTLSGTLGADPAVLNS